MRRPDGMRRHRASLTPGERDVATWPTADVQSLPESRAKKFLRNLDAVTRYMEGDKVQDICDDCGISKRKLYDLVDRCLETDALDGRIRGQRGCIPWSRNAPYTRTKEVGPVSPGAQGDSAGAFTQFLGRYPSIRRYLIALYLRKKIRIDGDLDTGFSVLVPRDTYRSIHRLLKKAWEKKGVGMTEYPRNRKHEGYKGMIAFLKSLLDGPELMAIVAARFGSNAVRKMGSGNPPQRPPPSDPYAVVEFDAHPIDALWIIYFLNKYGAYDPMVLDRVWLLTILERVSQAALGYSLCLTHNYSQFDVLRCIKNAINPWAPKTFDIPTFKYPPGSGFPSGIIPQCAWALWDLMVYDNAWGNLASNVRTLLKNVVGSDVNAGPKYVRDHQPFIEGFFKTQASTLFQRLPNTTGASPDDIRRQKPDEAALKLSMTYDDLKEIVELGLARYNAEPRGSEQRTPLEILSLHLASGDVILKRLQENRRFQLLWFNYRVTRTVRGSLKEGRRPFITFEYAKYTNELLRNMPSMIGQPLTFYVDPLEDIRFLPAFLENSAEFGVLEAQGEWSFSPHDLETRRAAYKLAQERRLAHSSSDDVVQKYLEHKYNEARKGKRKLNQYVKAQELSERLKPVDGPPTADPAESDVSTTVPSGADRRVNSRGESVFIIDREGRGDVRE